MAKIGNETKLILKLAKERMRQKVLTIRNSSDRDRDYRDGYVEAEMDYRNQLNAIVSELEQK